jgi:hypothetical protein
MKPGIAWIEKLGGFRFFDNYKQIIRGKRKGHYRVFITGRWYVIASTSIRRMPVTN